MLKIIKYIFPVFIIMAFYACTVDEPIGPDELEDPRDAYTGTWNCNENEVKRTKIAYTVSITKDPDTSNGLIMENFAYVGEGEFILGTLKNGIVSIPEQVPCEGWIVSGSGTYITENELHWTYSIEAGGDIINYSATFSR